MENLGLNPSFWHGKRVLVTGHTGFKGGWLTIWLQRLGAEVAGYALPASTNPSLFEVADVASDMHSIAGDIRDLDKIKHAVADFRPDIVIHMAAQALVRFSYKDPVDTYSTNVMGTVNVLEACRATESVRAIVNVTSDKCYENREREEGYREDEPMGGYDPYSNSKGCAELVTSAYRQSFFGGDSGTLLGSARAGNVIGGGDWAEDRLIPDMIRAFADGEAATIRNPGAIRPWQHVLEPLHGYLRLAERLGNDGEAFAEGWNFGPEDSDAQPVAWVADKMCKFWGDGATWNDGSSPDQPHEAKLLRLNFDKARERLGWRPRLQLAEALRWTVDWYKCFEDGGNVRALTEQQIADFETGTGLSA